MPIRIIMGIGRVVCAVIKAIEYSSFLRNDENLNQNCVSDIIITLQHLY